MKRISHQERVDALISQFWKNGYMTLSRKYGTYLPAPGKIGNYEVDAIGRYKKKYVIGIIITKDEFNDPKLISKISYLSSRNTKYSDKKVVLYVGVPKSMMSRMAELLSKLEHNQLENTKVIALPE